MEYAQLDKPTYRLCIDKSENPGRKKSRNRDSRMNLNLKKAYPGYVKVRSVDDPTTFAKPEKQHSEVTFF